MVVTRAKAPEAGMACSVVIFAVHAVASNDGFLSQASKGSIPSGLGRELQAIECSGTVQDCRANKCCVNPSFTCYEKNIWWAECRSTCTPGIDPKDLPDFQTPWSCNILKKGMTTTTTTTSTPACSGAKQDCRTSKCCVNPSFTCYEKNAWWGECRASCTPGIDPTDPPEFQTPWSCNILKKGMTTTTTTPSVSECSGVVQDCRASKCCAIPSFTCYEKNMWWAECRSICAPGIDPTDPPEFRTPWSCNILKKGMTTTTTTPSVCAGAKQDCRTSKCCVNPSFNCYEKNAWWGECRSSCTPGIDPNDLPEFQTPWSCTILANVATTTTSSSPPTMTTTASVILSTTSTADDKTPVAKHGQLRVQGNTIVNRDGDPVRLRGMSFFWSQWQGHYWTADTVRWLRDDWHVTLVRAALGIEHGGYLENTATEKTKLITIVDAAIEAGIYVIIDWHDHNAEQHVTEADAFFDEMAQKYGGFPNVLFETYNEPVGQSWAGEIKPYHEQMVSTIRRHTENIIILGTRFYSQYVDEASLDPVQGSNLAYTIHFYAAASGHGAQLRSRVSTALANGIALFGTEWGTCQEWGSGNLDLVDAQAWLDLFAAHHISDANWAVSNKDETCSALQWSAGKSGWTSTDLTPSGVWVRNSIRSDAGVGTETPTTTTGTGTTVTQTTGRKCSRDKSENCSTTKCCIHPAMTCYQKNQWWASCKDICIPGSIDPEDPPDFRTPWSCTVLGK